tara:strand:- start:271 stop:609 length:339 start_codon:yes stop_codon:yes gene_type:complete
MKLLFENWREYLTEDPATAESQGKSDDLTISDLMTAVSNLTGDERLENWAGNFFSVLNMYNRFVTRGKVGRAASYLDTINDMKFDDKTHGEWIDQYLPEFSKMWRDLNETTI